MKECEGCGEGFEELTNGKCASCSKTCEGCGEQFEPHELTDGYCADCTAEAQNEADSDDDAESSDPDSEHYLIDGVGFADEGGRSSLRAATRDNPRDQPCPTCKARNVLTRIDKQRGYQCDGCADAMERGGP